MDWNELCDESEDVLQTLENDCPPGVVTLFVDAPLAAKDISLPKTFCLSVFLEPQAETIIGILLEADARTIACNRLRIELEELKVMLSNERTEFKNALTDLKDIGVKISTAVVESVTDVPDVHTEEVCRDNVEDCIEDCGAEIAKAVTCESFYIGEEEPPSSNVHADCAFEGT